MNGREQLFASLRLVSQPVVALENGIILYMNPASLQAFGSEHEGKAASSLLPEHILGIQADSFVAGAHILGKSCTVRACTIETQQLYFIEPDEEHTPTNAAVLASMRSNLANIKIASDRICESIYPDKGSSLQRYSSALAHNYYQLKRLIVNLSAIEGISTDNLAFSPSVTNLTDLCTDIVSAVSSLAEDKGIAVSFDCQKQITAVADAELVELMILNLLSNSLLHMPCGGRVKLSMADISNYIMLTVNDSGEGIPAEELEYVFSRYSREISFAEMNGGAGLGLAIARGIAEKHGGVMIIESKPECGTTVRITLSKRISPSDIFKASEVRYSTKGMEDILTQMSTWLPPEAFIKEYQD